jgi:hypothetical protein
VAGDVAHAFEPASTDDKKSDHEKHQPRAAVVPAAVKADELEVATQELQPSIRSELLRAQLDRQIPVERR